MAYLPIERDEEQDPNQERRNQMFGGSAAPGVAPTYGGTGVASPGQPQPGAQSMAGGGDTGKFINFDRYISGNKEASERAAQQVGGNVYTQGINTQNDIGNAMGAHMQAANNAVLKYDPSSVTTNPSATASSTTTSGPSIYGTNPAAAPNYVSRDDAQKYANQAYKDPTGGTGLLKYGGLQDEVGEFGQKTAGLQSNAGVQAALQTQYGGLPARSYGGALDAALVGNAGKDRFNALQQQFQGLSKYLDDTNKGAIDYSKGAEGRNLEAQQKYQNLVGQYDAADKAKAEQQAWDDQNSAMDAGSQLKNVDELVKWLGAHPFKTAPSELLDLKRQKTKNPYLPGPTKKDD